MSHCGLYNPTGEFLFTRAQKCPLWLNQNRATSFRDIKKCWILSGQIFIATRLSAYIHTDVRTHVFIPRNEMHTCVSTNKYTGCINIFSCRRVLNHVKVWNLDNCTWPRVAWPIMDYVTEMSLLVNGIVARRCLLPRVWISCGTVWNGKPLNILRWKWCLRKVSRFQWCSAFH